MFTNKKLEKQKQEAPSMQNNRIFLLIEEAMGFSKNRIKCSGFEVAWAMVCA
jgi:hypothetical protein